MLIQELEAAIPAPPIKLSPFLAPEAIPPAFDFAQSCDGFAPTAILVELYGSLATPAKSGPIVSGLLLGLSGCHPSRLCHHCLFSILNDLQTTSTIRINTSIVIPFRPTEHIILHPTGLTLSHPDGIRLTAYYHLHPRVTRQYYATANSGQPDQPQISFIEY